MFRVEIIHGRDPDSPCNVTVYLSGMRLPDQDVYIADLDPGAGGPSRADWLSESSQIAHDPRLTREFKRALLAERQEWLEDSKWIGDDDDKKDGFRADTAEEV